MYSTIAAARVSKGLSFNHLGLRVVEFVFVFTSTYNPTCIV